MFFLAVAQVAKLFLFMLIGFVLTKKNVLPKTTPSVLSKILVWVATPALYVKTFATQFTPEKLPNSARVLLISLTALCVSYFLSRLLSLKLFQDNYTKNVFIYSCCVPNYGYMGNVLVLALFGEATLLQYQIFVLPLAVFVVTIGYSMLLEKKAGLKSLVNPMLIAVLLGIVLGLLRIPLPDFFVDTLTSASSCMGPLSMILAGCVIAEFDLKRILSSKDVYITVGARMLLMPLLAFSATNLLHLPQEVGSILLIFHCLPAGLNSVVYPSTIGKDCSLGAGLAVVSNLLALITVPLFLNFVF